MTLIIAPAIAGDNTVCSVAIRTYGMSFASQITRAPESFIQHLPPHLIPLPADPHRILPQLRPKRLLYHQNRFEGLDVHVAEEPLKPPPHSLPRHPKGFMNLLAVCPLEDHIAGLIRLQLYPQILRFNKLSQFFQELLVFSCQFHV